MQCSHPQCSDHVSGLNALRAWAISCSTRATLEVNSWITICIVASFFCLPLSFTSVLVSCMGYFMYSEIKTLLFHLILRVDSANSMWMCNPLAWNVIDFKITQLHWKLYSHILVGVSGKQWLIVICILIFCHINSTGISILPYYFKHFSLNNGIPHFGWLTFL